MINDITGLNGVEAQIFARKMDLIDERNNQMDLIDGFLKVKFQYFY